MGHEENIKRIAAINNEIETVIRLLSAKIINEVKGDNEIVIMNIVGQSLFTCMATILTSLELHEMSLQIMQTMLISYLQKAVLPAKRKFVVEQICKDLLESIHWNEQRDERKKSKLH